MKVPVKRVEAQVGRTFAEWDERHVTRVIAEIKAVQDGMADPSEIWPEDFVEPPPPTPTATEGEPSDGKTDTKSGGRRGKGGKDADPPGKSDAAPGGPSAGPGQKDAAAGGSAPEVDAKPGNGQQPDAGGTTGGDVHSGAEAAEGAKAAGQRTDAQPEPEHQSEGLKTALSELLKIRTLEGLDILDTEAAKALTDADYGKFAAALEARKRSMEAK
ncbi:MAG: hypothetical protein HC889_00770 [Synechococcaceae cyanobacterium SM1_2_3]|nr:hypothetical protein [Synechococcaceae cyanobacterium SM1_2_3]